MNESMSGFTLRTLPGQVYHWLEGLEDWGREEHRRLVGELPQPLLDDVLAYSPKGKGQPLWVKNVWYSPVEIRFSSINEAAQALRSLGALWSNVPGRLHRRAALIQDKLPRLPQKPKPFPFPLPSTPLGAWTLLEENTLWASPNCRNPFPQGTPPLMENKSDPPSSAYAKLQEALLYYGKTPQPGDFCLDLGAAPGGWTWVLLELGATVHSVDRAPLDARLLSRPGLTTRQQDAFSLTPDQFDAVDWLVCDVICYPAKLWSWLEPWLASGKVKHYVVTIKMQGEPDWDTLERFAQVPGSRLLHLAHNKHEVTWIF